MPASGKTSVGARLAELLDCPFLDVDAQIEKAQRRSVADIFAVAGEAEFRRLEEAATLRALEREAVVALGGGAVTSAAVRQALHRHRVVWLQANVPTAVARMGGQVDRPLLAGDPARQLAGLMAERTPLYAEVADLVVPTDGRGVDEIAAEIVDWLSHQPAEQQADAGHQGTEATNG